MVRFRRKRYYKKSTNVIRMKFQSYMDISTTDESMQIITISAGGKEVLRRLGPQFGAYKYYKLGNISAKLVPASSLPVDPTGLSYEAGAQTVDPRDQLTPGMMRITNGEDIFEDITGLSADQQHGIYNNMLLDPRWYKWMLQSGVKRHATPRYWTIGQLHQDKFPGSEINLPKVGTDISSNPYIAGTSTLVANVSASSGAVNIYSDSGSSPYGLFQTGHTGRLGWLPTDGLVRYHVGYNSSNEKDTPMLASPVEVEVMKVILPKAYKTRYYYRLYISETVFFKEPIVNFGIVDSNGYGYSPLDVFHAPGMPSPRLPSTAGEYNIPDTYTGGNYGDS